VVSDDLRDHGDPGDAPSIPPPLVPPSDTTRPSAAEEARTIAASTNSGTLATLTTAGDPWASFVAYGLLGGAPVLCVSNLAEHGRNLTGDPRASIAIVAATIDSDPLANSRITLSGVAEKPTGDELAAARQAHLDAVPAAKYYVDYSDFTLWVLRMDSATGADSAAAEPDPVQPIAAGAIEHLNADNAEALTAMSKTLGGYPDTIAATCTGADRYGLDLKITTARGVAYPRVGYAERIDSQDQFRSATAELTRRARQG
jgi:putative heme iron utilization protein